MSPKVSKEHMVQRRALIMEKAMEVFMEHGYEQTTMKHIMDAANVSRGGLYQYFSNKEDVYETLLEERLAQSAKEAELLFEEEIHSHWELLMTSIFGNEEQPNDKMDPMAPSNLEFFITGRNNQRRREYGTLRYYAGLKIYKDIIEQGQQSGEFSSKYECEVLARTIVSFFDGLALEDAILPKEDLKIKEQATLFVEYLKMALEVKNY